MPHCFVLLGSNEAKRSVLLLNTDPTSWLNLKELASTNTFLLNGDFAAGTVCLAQHQSAGRGALGHSWANLRDQAFLFSGRLHDSQLKTQAATSILDNACLLPLLSAVAVLAALYDFSRDSQEYNNHNKIRLAPVTMPKIPAMNLLAQGKCILQIKWPNDIYMLRQTDDDPNKIMLLGKLGGILVETRGATAASKSHGTQGQDIVIGIGLNWQGNVAQLSKLIQQSQAQDQITKNTARKNFVPPAILFPHATQTPLSRETKAAQVIPKPISFLPYLIRALNLRLQQWQQGKHDFIIEELRRSFYLKNKLVLYRGKSYRVEGLAQNGALLLSDSMSKERIALTDHAELSY